MWWTSSRSRSTPSSSSNCRPAAATAAAASEGNRQTAGHAKAEATPPPAYVPPPEIAAPATDAAPLQAVAETAPAKTAPAEVAPPPELPAAPPKPEKLTVDGSCPGYANTLRQAFAGLYDKYEIAGTVTVRVQVRGNAITKVNVVSGPREYQRAVVAAVSSLSCQVSGGAEGYFELPIVFREE